MANDWLPGRRAAQIEMAKQWKPHVTAQKTAWSIPNAEVTRLGNAIELVDQCQEDVERNPSPGNRAALRDAFRVLVSVMRFFKTRYFLTCSKAQSAFGLGYDPGVLRSKTLS